MRRRVVSHRAQGDGTEVFHFSLDGAKASISLPGSLIEMLAAHHQALGETRSGYIKRLIIEDLEQHGIHWQREKFIPVRRVAA
jgi:hypothetical protein